MARLEQRLDDISASRSSQVEREVLSDEKEFYVSDSESLEELFQVIDNEAEKRKRLVCFHLKLSKYLVNIAFFEQNVCRYTI